MADTTTLSAFLVTVLVMELTPGPNMGYLALLSAQRGWRSGLAATLGIALGLICLAVISALGLAALVNASPALYALLRWVGVAFLLYLAVEAWRESGVSSVALPDVRQGRHALRGFVVNLLNPKAGLFFIAVLPEFLAPGPSVALQAVGLAMVSVGVATAVHLTIVLLADRVTRLLAPGGPAIWFQRGSAVMLAGIAVWLWFSTAPG